MVSIFISKTRNQCQHYTCSCTGSVACSCALCTIHTMHGQTYTSSTVCRLKVGIASLLKFTSPTCTHTHVHRGCCSLLLIIETGKKCKVCDPTTEKTHQNCTNYLVSETPGTSVQICVVCSCMDLSHCPCSCHDQWKPPQLLGVCHTQVAGGEYVHFHIIMVRTRPGKFSLSLLQGN